MAELLITFFRFRVDAVASALLVGAAGWYCHRFMARRAAQTDFPRAVWVLVAAVMVGGVAAAEWMAGAVDLAAPGGPMSVFVARSMTLGGTMLLAGAVLAGATLFALMQAEARAHAEAVRQLEAAKVAADAAGRAKSDFLAVMSHEIRTPLNAVVGFANLLADTPLDEAQRDYLATIHGEGRRLGALINDILDLSKLEEGRLALERLPFAPAEIVHEVLRLFAARAAERRIELRFEAQMAGGLILTGDPLRFRQVLLNLLDNALKFTPAGTVTLFLHWQPEAEGIATGRLAVRVRDTGIGIPKEKQQGLFRMFTQVDSSTTRRYGGTGLGLAICQRLVGLMGGRIAVSSEAGRGSEFSFELPLTAMAGAEQPEATVLAPAALPARRPRVLVVDDLETNRFMLEVFLKRQGFEPELAASGAEAIQLATARDYDAILMDITMPDLDGYEATQRIRAVEPQGKHIPIIALTASITKGTREKCLAAGMDEYLTKPLDLRRFKTLLTNQIAATQQGASTLLRNVAAMPT